MTVDEALQAAEKLRHQSSTEALVCTVLAREVLRLRHEKDSGVLFSEIVKMICEAPTTWIPELTAKCIEAGHAKCVWAKDAADRPSAVMFVRLVEERMRK